MEKSLDPIKTQTELLTHQCTLVQIMLATLLKGAWTQRWANTLTYWSARRQRQYFRPMIESTKNRNFSKNFRKDLNQNIDQSPDICSKSSNDRNVFAKKKKKFKSRPCIFKTP